MKSKGEREGYTQLNAEFNMKAKIDKKVFFNEQCKEIEENTRMGKTRDLFKKTRDTKGNFHAKMGAEKYKNSKNLTETEDIKKGGQQYTEELYQNSRNDPDSRDGVITHLEPEHPRV